MSLNLTDKIYIDRNNVMVVDVIAVFFSHAGKSVQNFITTLDSLARTYAASAIIMCADRKDGDSRSNFRTQIRPIYKKNRDERIKEQTPEQKEEALSKLENYRRFLELCEETETYLGETPKYLVRMRGVEADDLAAFFVSKLRGVYDNIWLISVDGDWDQLLEDDVHRFSVQTRKEYTLDTFFDTHKVRNPTEFVHVKSLTGDPKDNVIGGEGVGPTRARSALASFGGSVFDLVANLPLPGNQKYIKSINDMGAEYIIDNYTLLSLRDHYWDAITASPDNPDFLNTLVQRLIHDRKRIV